MVRERPLTKPACIALETSQHMTSCHYKQLQQQHISWSFVWNMWCTQDCKLNTSLLFYTHMWFLTATKHLKGTLHSRMIARLKYKTAWGWKRNKLQLMLRVVAGAAPKFAANRTAKEPATVQNCWYSQLISTSINLHNLQSWEWFREMKRCESKSVIVLFLWCYQIPPQAETQSM